MAWNPDVVMVDADCGDSSAPHLLNPHSNETRNDIVNFSRKRELREHQSRNDGGSEHESKRYRSVNWPSEAQEKDSSQSRNDMTSPIRVSRFKEESMHDRPSSKPPSPFTKRLQQHVTAGQENSKIGFNGNAVNLHAESKTLPRGFMSRSPERKASKTKAFPGSQISDHEANASSVSGEGAEMQRGGIFKFGKSMASAFNPVSMWSRVSSGWRTSKDEAMVGTADAQADELAQRQLKAEQTYAELKRNGTLGTLGSRTISNGTTIYTPGYTQPAKEPASQRDSGIAMDSESRTSTDTAKTPFLQPPDLTVDKSRRQSRTPSFHNLKKMASEINLNRRSSSMSPEKRNKDFAASPSRRSKSRGNIFELFSDGEGTTSLRSSRSTHDLAWMASNADGHGSVHSKKDLAKKSKLSKRVSDLEAKLESARKELDRALNAAPPVPPIPDLPGPAPQSLTLHSVPRIDRGYVPGLPTLLSESLLLPSDEPAIVLAPHTEIKPLESKDAAQNDAEREAKLEKKLQDDRARELRKANGNGLSVQQTIAAAKFHATSKETLPGTPESDIGRPLPKLPAIITKREPPSQGKTFLAVSAGPSTESLKKAAPVSIKEAKELEAAKLEIEKVSPPGRAKSSQAKKRRTSKEDQAYRPKNNQEDADSDWEDTKPKTLKKKKRSSPGDKAKDKSNAGCVTQLPVTTGSLTTKRKVLAKSAHAHVQKVLLPATALAQSDQNLEIENNDDDVFLGDAKSTSLHYPTTLDTVPEEMSTSQSIDSKDISSGRPAKASTARLHKNQTRTGSPLKTKGSLRRPNRGNGPASRAVRSSSPPPSSPLGKESAADRLGNGASPVRSPKSPKSPILRRSPAREMLRNNAPVFTAKPNGHDVPYFPGQEIVSEELNRDSRLARKESFEWPDDVF